MINMELEFNVLFYFLIFNKNVTLMPGVLKCYVNNINMRLYHDWLVFEELLVIVNMIEWTTILADDQWWLSMWWFRFWLFVIYWETSSHNVNSPCMQSVFSIADHGWESKFRHIGHGGNPKTTTDIRHGQYLTALMQSQNEIGSSKLQTSFKDQSWVIVYICFYMLCDFKTWKRAVCVAYKTMKCESLEYVL